MLVNLAGSEYLTNKDLAARWNLSRRATIRRRQRLGLLPDEFLGLMPLHAAWRVDDTRVTGRRYAIDDVGFFR